MWAGMLQQVAKARFLLNENSTTILTGTGIVGTVATAYLSSRASLKAARIIDQAQKEIQEFELEHLPEGNARAHVKELTRTEKFVNVWYLYIPPVGVGVVTVASIFFAHRISTKQIAALAVAGGISERALQEYKEKVVEKLGDRQNTAIRDQIAQDRVNANTTGQEVILVGAGQVLCYDLSTDRYFQNTMEGIRQAENKINSELLHHMSASLAEFHDLIGLRPTNYTDSVGWGSPEMFKVIFSTVMSPDGRPCIAIDFERPPQLEYNRAY